MWFSFPKWEKFCLFIWNYMDILYLVIWFCCCISYSFWYCFCNSPHIFWLFIQKTCRYFSSFWTWNGKKYCFFDCCCCLYNNNVIWIIQGRINKLLHPFANYSNYWKTVFIESINDSLSTVAAIFGIFTCKLRLYFIWWNHNYMHSFPNILQFY